MHLRRLICLWAMLLLLTACGGDESPTPVVPVAESSGSSAVENTNLPEPTNTPVPTATPLPDLNGTLVIWHHWTGSDGDALAQILANASDEYPNLTVETLFVAYSDLPRSYAEAVLAGSGPDLLLAPNWWLNDFVNAEVIAPLDPLLSPSHLDAYWPATLENMRFQNQLYGIPTNFELVSLYYNRALVGPERLPKTTEELLSLAREAPSQGFGLYLSLYNLYWGFPAYGGQLLDESGMVVLDQNNGAADFLGWLKEADSVDGSFVDLDYGMLIDRFKKGEYAFFVDGPWSVGELQGALGDNLGVTQLPAGLGGPAQPWLSAEGIFINPNISPEAQGQALALAHYMTNPESSLVLAQLAKQLPANRTVVVDDDPILSEFMQQATSAQSMPTLPEMNEVWGYGGDMFFKVLSGAEPSSVVVETAALINEANGR